MDVIIHDVDVAVIGGGLAGTCAAIAAARQGAKVVLVEQREVLGGNGSSLVRVHIGGAPDHGWHFDARETGIIEELRLTYAVKDPANSYAWIDAVLRDACLAEPSLSVHHGIAIDAVEIASHGVDGYTNRIVSCSGTQQGSETRHVFKAKLFVDGTGDGTVGALAGAEHRVGREARAEFGESIAPDVADTCVLGSSIMLEARDMGDPVPFTPPPWAKKLPADYSRNRGGRVPDGGHEGNGYWHGTMHAGWWWNELGGTLDTIRDDARIKHELLATLYGLWDHVKNSGDPRYANAANYDITWVGAIPGKRESRRIVGDYILKQDDLTSGIIFPDQVAAGGWTIDLHPPRGFLDDEPPCSQTRLRDLYTIPFRCIYSRNVSNLLVASRCLSVTHVAHGSTRLQATLATVGQAAGIAAAWCAREGITPRALGRERFSAYQQELCKRDGFLLDFQNDDPSDLAWSASVSASSSHPLHFGDAGAWIPLLFPVAQQFPAVPLGNGGEISSIDILVRNASGMDAHLEGGVHEASHVGDFSRPDDIASMKGTCPAGTTTWVSFTVDPPIPVEPAADPSRPQLLWFYVTPPAGDVLDVSVGKDVEHYPGFRGGYFDEDAGEWCMARTHGKSQLLASMVRPRGVYCFSIPGFTAFPVENVINGYRRPGTRGSNLWMSDPAQGFPQWLELDLGGDVHPIEEIHVVFDNGLDKAYPHAFAGDYRRWPFYGRPPRCPKDFDVVAIDQDAERLVAAIRGNYQRQVVVKVARERASKIRIVFHASNGGNEVGVYEVRVY